MSADEIIIEYRTNKENELKDMQAWKRFLQEIKYDPKTATAEYIDNNGKKSRVAFRIGRGLYDESNGIENDKSDHNAYHSLNKVSRITMIPHKGYKVGDYLQTFKHEASHVNQWVVGDTGRGEDPDLSKLHSQKMLKYTIEFIKKHPELNDHDREPKELLADLSAVITQGAKSWKRCMLKEIKAGPVYAKNQGKLSGKRFNEDRRKTMDTYNRLLTALEYPIVNRNSNKAKVEGSLFGLQRKYGKFYEDIVYQLDNSDLKNDRNRWSNELQKLDSNVRKSIERLMEILTDTSKTIPINSKENLKKKGVDDSVDYVYFRHNKEIIRETNIIRKNANAMMTIVMKHGGYGFDPNSHKREYEAAYRARIKFVEQALKDKPWQESYTDDNNMENMYCECLLEELDYDDDEIFIEEFIDECISSFEAYSENVEISW
jgi:hypothetical protein